MMMRVSMEEALRRKEELEKKIHAIEVVEGRFNVEYDKELKRSVEVLHEMRDEMLNKVMSINSALDDIYVDLEI